MSESNPQKSDAVLGGQNPPPLDAVVLGGLDGFTQRFASESLSAKLQLLKDIIKYGAVGIDLALQSLSDPSAEVQRLARKLLRTQAGEEGKAALLDREPLSYFATLADWRREIYNPEVGIVDPENNAYVVNIVLRTSNSDELPDYDFSLFESLIQDPNIFKLQVLIFQINTYAKRYFGHGRYDDDGLLHVFEKFKEHQSCFANIKGLFFGDIREHRYRKTKIRIFDLHSILEAHPKLEILQIRGYLLNDSLPLEPVSHEKLRSIIIECHWSNDRCMERLCNASFPALEYMEFWLGTSKNTAAKYYSVFSGLSNNFSKLKSLALVSGEGMDELVDFLVSSSIIDRLSILNLSMGNLTDRGAKLLIECPAIDKIKILDVSHNCISRELVRKLSTLSCEVKIQPQRKMHEGVGSRNRFFALHE
jgi:hypothetical protein